LNFQNRYIKRKEWREEERGGGGVGSYKKERSQWEKRESEVGKQSGAVETQGDNRMRKGNLHLQKKGDGKLRETETHQVTNTRT